MVTAGIRNINTHGAMLKRGPSEAYSPSNKFMSPGKTHNTKLTIARKTTIKM
jgi:hypothetical protein